MIVRYGTRSRHTRARSTEAAVSAPAAGAFLSAQVGVQNNGTPLSVLSIFARQKIDPSDEVNYLSSLARGEAVARLTAMILAASVGVPDMCGASARASDLISLLPAFDEDKPKPELPQYRTGRIYRSPFGGRQRGGRLAPDIRHGRSAHHYANHARLLVVLVAAAILVTIGIVDPKSIGSSTTSFSLVNTTAESAPAAMGQTHP